MQVEIIHEDSTVILRFSGEIDEDADFSPVAKLTAKNIIIDVEGVKLLNSLGLRNWTFWIKTFPVTIPIVFKRCPKVVVDQMNILRGFMPRHAIVESFYVPYYNEGADKDQMVLVERGKDFQEATADKAEMINIKQEIEANGGTMELDIMPEKYFSFLKYRAS